MDKYPAHLTLLPHQEIFYQRVLPMNMIFHYRASSGENNGGRTLVHSGLMLESIIKNNGKSGINFIKKLKKYGQTIITGFLDENHSLKDKNFVRSWQDRFNSHDIAEAMKICLEQVTNFDDCWFEKTDEKNKLMLMTKVTMPLFKKYKGVSYMMFPRIAYDKPSVINGFRKFIIGNGEDCSEKELNMLLEAYWKTRQGIYQKNGDLLLIDNIKFAHSREPFIEHSSRDAAVIMGGQFFVDKIKK